MIIRNHTEKIIYWLLPLFYFMVPISTFGTSVCLFGLILVWLITGDLKKKGVLYWQHPVVRVFLILILGSLISFFYTEAAPKDALNGVKDSLRLGIIGILLYYFLQQPSDKLQKRCLYAFILAMLITAVLSYLKYFFHLLPYKPGLTEAAVFKNHIKTSFFMTIAIYFIANELRTRPRNLFLWIACALMATNVLFMSEGRIGYVIFCILAMYYFWDIAKIRGLVCSLFLLMGIILVSQQFSLKIYQRIAQIPQDVENFIIKQDVTTSSIGARLSFIETSKSLIQERPWLGWGVGGFRQAFQSYEKNENLQSDNPHNEYLRIAVEFGAVGLIWFAWLIFAVYQSARKIPVNQQFLITGVFGVFLLGCFANSWLMDFSEGMFIILFLSLFLGKDNADNLIHYRHHI